MRVHIGVCVGVRVRTLLVAACVYTDVCARVRVTVRVRVRTLLVAACVYIHRCLRGGDFCVCVRVAACVCI